MSSTFRHSNPALVVLVAVGLVYSGACFRRSGVTPDDRVMVVSRADPRTALRGGLFDAEQALWNMRLLSTTPPTDNFGGHINSDLAFTGTYVIQGNFNGWQIWDISDPRHPVLTRGFVCPGAQGDVSVFGNLLFVSSEDLAARGDCGSRGVPDTVSAERLRGIRIVDISDPRNPRRVSEVQTCRGSHTHSVFVDPVDTTAIYLFVSGSAPIRPANELSGCSRRLPEQDPQSARFRIEVIRVPLAHPDSAAIVTSPRIFADLVPPPVHGESPTDAAELARIARAARSRGELTALVGGAERALPAPLARMLLDSVVKTRGGQGTATSADSAVLRVNLQRIVDRMFDTPAPRFGPTQCHDMTLYPTMGLGAGACEGYGLLLDTRDPRHPTRIAEVADSNFAYWHSAIFNNDGTKVLFMDEWGSGLSPKCRATDPPEWGADALFAITKAGMQFQGYYKLPAVQSALENCVAHNGSLVPIPGRDVVVQGWYQGGVSVFDWTDARRPEEIAYFDRGPANPTRLQMAGSWSAYWYNGVIVSSEIARGLDILELTPSALLTQNEIDAARTVRLDYFNPQGQPHLEWPATFALSRAYVDQLVRSRGLAPGRITEIRNLLASVEHSSAPRGVAALAALALALGADANGSVDAAKVRLLAESLRGLGSGLPPQP